MPKGLAGPSFGPASAAIWHAAQCAPVTKKPPIASEHWLSDGQHYADLEWLAGYLALRFRRDPGSARQHFANFRTAVFTPISLGRAGYWEGRAEEQ